MHEPMMIFHVTTGGQLPRQGQDPRDEDLRRSEVSEYQNYESSTSYYFAGVVWEYEVPHDLI